MFDPDKYDDPLIRDLAREVMKLQSQVRIMFHRMLELVVLVDQLRGNPGGDDDGA